MKITVTGRKIELTDGIRNHLNKKLNKTIANFSEPSNLHIALSVEKHRHFAEINLKTKGCNVSSHEETPDLYSSMDKALNKLAKQLRKQKKKAKDLRIKQASNSKNQFQD